MDTNFSNELKLVLEASRKEAIKHNNDIIQPEHLLLSLLADVSSKAFALMENITIKHSINELQQQLSNRLYNIAPSANVAITVSDLANRIIKLSVLEARMLKSDIVDVEHLLLAIFHNSEVLNMQFMEPFHNAGITYESIYRQLANVPDSPKFGTGFAEDEEIEDDDVLSNNDHVSSRHTATKTTAKRGNDTPVLDKFGNDMTKAAEEGRLDPVVGRENEIERLVQILSRRKKNNPVLIGEPGVGKSAIVEGLAIRITERKVSRVLFDKRVISLDMASIVAGTKYR